VGGGFEDGVFDEVFLGGHCGGLFGVNDWMIVVVEEG